MSEHIAPHDTAHRLGITPATLRRWCEYHAAYLSPGAQPLPGQARRFAERDIEVLLYCKQLRAQGLTVASINEQLPGLTFAEIDATQVDVAIASVDAQDARDGALAPIVGQDYYLMSIERRFEALQASMDEVRRTPGTSQRDGVIMFGFGFVAALLFVLLMLGIAVLYGGFR